MSKPPRARRPPAAPKPAPAVRRERWPAVAAAAITLVALLWAYQPAIGGPFLFDDTYLPFALPGFEDKPLSDWVRGVRPLLMLTFWLNFRFSGQEPYWYHVVNVMLHLAGGAFVFFIARRLLEWAGETARRDLLAGFAAGLFLLHPLQTEAVAYVASRSENLSVMLIYGAFTVFLGRSRAGVSWLSSLAVVGLFAAAVLSKEHAVVLPALLLLTDCFWNHGSPLERIRKNWRLYAPLTLAGALGMAFVWRILGAADTAGFALKGLPWHHYLFTECRAVWVYARMFVLPYGQNVDPEFPISHSPLEHGSALGMAALVVLAAGAFRFRRRYPLACYGALVFLLLLAPTSSLVPIQDPLAERRVYLASLGLILVALEFLRRWQAGKEMQAAALAAVLLAAGGLTWARNHVWSSPFTLWEDAVAKSPRKFRPRFQLAFAHYQVGQCGPAVEHYAKAAQLEKPDYRLLVDWALAYDCLGRPADALARLREAAALKRTAHVWALIGMVYGKQGQASAALDSLRIAEKLDPAFAMTYVYRGNVYFTTGDFQGAAAEFRRALKIAPNNESALDGLRKATKMATEAAR